MFNKQIQNKEPLVIALCESKLVSGWVRNSLQDSRNCFKDATVGLHSSIMVY